MAISGEKPVQEMMMIGWIMCKKEVEIKGFRKVFRIPDVVDLERIKAKYIEEESTLRIVMKKKVKGICGVKIEEDNEQEEEVPKVEQVDTKEPEKVPKAEFDEKKEREEEPKVEFVEKKVPNVEDKIQSNEEIDQRQVESREGVEKLSKIETEPEESEAEEEEEEEVAGAVENVVYEEPEKVDEVIMRQEPEIETVEKPGQVSEEPEEKIAAPVAAAAPPPTFSEPEIMESEVVEPQMTEIPSMEEPPDEIQKIPEPVEEPEEKEETADEATEQPEVPSLPPISQAEEDEKFANEDDQAQSEDLKEEHESGDDVQEFEMEPEPDQEPKEEAETPTQDQHEDESDKQESEQEMENENAEGEIGEEMDDQEEHFQGDNTSASPEIDADKDPIEGASMEEEKRKKSKLRKPLMFAGSAFLVSLIVLVINLLRARKR